MTVRWRHSAGDVGDTHRAYLAGDLAEATAVEFQATPVPLRSGQTSIKSNAVIGVAEDDGKGGKQTPVDVTMPTLTEDAIGNYVMFFQVTTPDDELTWPNVAARDELVVGVDPSGV